MTSRHTTLLCVAILILVLGALYWVNQNTQKKDKYLTKEIPTASAVELIEQRPDFNVIDEGDDMELIHPGDIALGAGFGIGEGTVGFGRYGSSFMA